MKYNQPYGKPAEVVLGDQPYVNGDPSIARAGSIPPAESIEYDQREIVKVIQWAYDHGYIDMNGVLCEAPTNTKLDQLLKALFGIMNSRLLRAPKTYYVNNATGNDTTLDGSQPTVSGGAGPFKTIQKALDMMATWNLNGYPFFIQVAAGSYSGVTLPTPNGSTAVSIIGPAVSFPTRPTVVISGVNQSAVKMGGGGIYSLNYLELNSVGTPPAGDPGSCIYAYEGHLFNGPLALGSSVGYQVYAQTGAKILMGDTLVTGNAPGMMNADYASSNLVDILGPPGYSGNHDLTFLGATNYTSTTLAAASGSVVRFVWRNIFNPGFVTAKKYGLSSNAVLETGGAGAAIIPGATAGTATTGGQIT